VLDGVNTLLMCTVTGGGGGLDGGLQEFKNAKRGMTTLGCGCWVMYAP
jgi:hypothetical protein